MSEFRKADSSVYETFLEMIEKVFPALSGYSFGLLYREKIKKSKGHMIFAEICLPSKLLSYFARNDQGNPYDFLIVVDEMVWATSRPEDRVRIMRHELRHVYISEKGDRKLIDHDFQDFFAEVDLNADNPSWTKHVAEVALAGYDQVKNGHPDPRVNRKDAEDISPVTKDPQRQTHLPMNDPDPGKANFERIANKVSKEDADALVDLEAQSKAIQKRANIDIKRSRPNTVRVESEDVVSRLDAMARKRGLLPPLSAGA